MKRIFFATAILATFSSYGMEDLKIKRTRSIGAEDQKTLKLSPRLSSDNPTRRPSDQSMLNFPKKEVPEIARARAQSNENIRFRKEENIVPREEKEGMMEQNPFLFHHLEQQRALFQILSMKEAKKTEKY